jgi:hypothetical protein
MEEIRFTRSFGKRDEKSYVKLHFDVPDGIDRIEFQYDYARFREEGREGGTARIEANVVDLGIYDHRGTLRGWSGSQRREAVVSEYTATPGYRQGPIAVGRWAIVLGIYKVEKEVKVDVVVRLVPKKRILLAGDIHMHTTNSDGSYATADVIEYCRRAGLDFMALTDHNNTEQNGEIGKPAGITVIPGMEYTNYRGHANFLFPGLGVDFDADPLSADAAEMLTVFRRAKELGALISLNHPHCNDCPWELGFDEPPYDLVEVWNGPMKPSEVRAVEWWHETLASGRRVAAVGGSDTHKIDPFRVYGSPTTFAYADSRSVLDILSALRAGRSFIAASPQGPYPDLRIGDAGLGETILYKEGLAGEASLGAAKKGDTLTLRDGKGGKAEWRAPFDGDVSFRFPASPSLFYRLEVRRERLGEPTLVALTNPVYVDSPTR